MSSPLRIVFLTGFANTQGTYFRWHNWAIGLQELGHKVDVYAFEQEINSCSRTEMRDGIEYHILPSSPGQSFFGHFTHPLNVLKGINATLPKADVYHIFQPFPISAIRGWWHRKNARFLVYDWDDLWYGGLINPVDLRKGFYHRYVAWAINKIEQQMPSRVDAVTVCGSFLENKARERGAKNTQIIYNGFWNKSQVVDKNAIREKMGFVGDDFYFGFMGRTVEELDWCFDVLRLVKDKNVKLALCGMQESVYEPFKSEFSNRVLFLGQLTPSHAKEFACAIDCGLLPLEDNAFNQSRFPIKFAEYLSSGANVICSDVGEVARLGRSFQGITFAGISRPEWQKAILELIEQRKNETNLDPFPEQIAERLDWQAICKELEGFYLRNII